MDKDKLRQAQRARQIQQAKLVAQQIAQEALYNYHPDSQPGHDQLAFHKSKARIRIMCGGTGSGKTICTMAEVAAAATGQSKSLSWIGEKYPDPPVHCWIVKQAFPTNIETDSVLIKLLKGDEYCDPQTGEVIKHDAFIPPRFKPHFNKKDNVIYLANGSTIELKSSEQDILKFASTGVNLIVIDEPIREDIWMECVYRTIRRKGSRVLFALSPIDENMSYLYDMKQEKDRSRVEVFRISTAKNDYLDKSVKQHILDMTPEHDRATRIEGVPASETGLVYGEWDNWIRPFDLKHWWTRYVVHDPGQDNPAATLWCAVDEDGNIYLYRCLYNTSKTANVRVLCEEIQQANEQDQIEEWFIDPFAGTWRVPNISDPMAESETLITLYQSCGIPFVPGPKQQDLAGRIQRIQTTKNYIDPTNRRFPMIYAFDDPDMNPLRKELRLYRWERNRGTIEKNEPDTPRRKHDHLMYCMETMCALQLPFVRKRGTPVSTRNDVERIMQQTAKQFSEGA